MPFTEGIADAMSRRRDVLIFPDGCGSTLCSLFLPPGSVDSF